MKVKKKIASKTWQNRTFWVINSKLYERGKKNDLRGGGGVMIKLNNIHPCLYARKNKDLVPRTNIIISSIYSQTRIRSQLLLGLRPMPRKRQLPKNQVFQFEMFYSAQKIFI